MPKNEEGQEYIVANGAGSGLRVFPIILAIIALILCFFLLFRQYHMQQRVYDLEGQVALLTLEASADEQIDSGRLVDVAEADITDSWGTFYEDREARLAELEAEALAAQFDPDKAAHKVYLTFDDGPSQYTEQILDILDEYNVKATFFVIGREDDYAKNMYREIVERGHTLGMHSYSHRYDEIYKSKKAFTDDYNKISSLLTEATGQTPVFYRFPGGSSNTVSRVDMHELADYLREQGVVYYDWNVSSGDAKDNGVPVEEIVYDSTLDIESRKTSVILFHDTAMKETTVQALPEILETILAMEDTAILPITDNTELVQHIQ